jgi:Skp family chaperone for outer membrane proteins
VTDRTGRSAAGLLCAALLWGAAGRAAALEIPLTRGADSGRGGTSVGYVDMDSVFQEYPETLKAKNEYYEELGRRREFLKTKEEELGDLKEQLAVLRAALKDLAGPAGGPVPPVDGATPPGAADDFAAAVESGAGATTAPAPSLDGSPVPPIEPSPPTGEGAPVPPGEDAAFGTDASPVPLGAADASLLQREQLLAVKEAELERARADAARELKTLEERRTLQIMGKLYHALVQIAEERGISLVVDKSSILYGHEAVDLTESLRRRVRGLPDTDDELLR